MKKYEYKMVKLLSRDKGMEDIRVLNEAGYDGWELVTAVPITGMGNLGGAYFYFRKELG